MPRKATKTLVQEFEEATRAHEIRGCQHPQDVPYIEQEFKEAKSALLDRIDELEGKKP